MQPLTNAEIRKLKAQAQLLEPMFKVGKAGLSDGFVKSVAKGLSRRQLVKVKFAEFKEQKKTLGPELAEKTASHLIMRVGHVVVLYLPKPAAEAVAEGP
jgi:RNA-binding protein